MQTGIPDLHFPPAQNMKAWDEANVKCMCAECTVIVGTCTYRLVQM